MRDQGNRHFDRRYLVVLCLIATLTGLLSLLAQPDSAAQANPTATPTVLETATSATPPATATTTLTAPAETPTATATGTAAATVTGTEPPQATETPAPTETLAPTETPLPTETAAPTSTPSTTPTATITVVVAELVPTSTPNLTSEQEQIGTITVLVFVGIVVAVIVFAVRWMVRAARRPPGEE